MIARIDELLRDELKVLPHLVDLLDKAPEAIEAVIDGRIKDLRDTSQSSQDGRPLRTPRSRGWSRIRGSDATSTFSYDIACPVSPGDGRATEGTEPKTGE
jgi:hypothetical protein